MYAMVEIQIDIAFTNSIISQCAKNPSSEHFNAIHQILNYLTGNHERRIKFGGKKKLKLVGYSHSK